MHCIETQVTESVLGRIPLHYIKLYGWLNLIIDSLLPFLCVEKTSFRDSLKLNSFPVDVHVSYATGCKVR